MAIAGDDSERAFLPPERKPYYDWSLLDQIGSGLGRVSQAVLGIGPGDFGPQRATLGAGPGSLPSRMIGIDLAASPVQNPGIPLAGGPAPIPIVPIPDLTPGTDLRNPVGPRVLPPAAPIDPRALTAAAPVGPRVLPPAAPIDPRALTAAAMVDDSTASDVTPPLPIPAGRAPVVYENTPDPWSRSIDPVGPGFVRQPTLVNNVWKPPPGGYTTEDNPRFHEGTPAFQADLAAHTLQGYRPLENKAMPGTPLAAALDAYNQGLPELVARRNAGVQTPAGPAAIGIRTLRGRTPGLIAGYTPEQEAAMRQGGIHLVTGPAGEFEWNASNVGLPSQIWEQRRAQALKESQAAANVQLHRAQTEHWEAEARKAERGEDPEAIKQARINQILGKNPALMDPRVNPLFAREAGVLPLTPEQNVLASMNRQQVPETMPTLLEAAEVPIPELMAVPAYRKELEEAARNVAGGLPPEGRGWLRGIQDTFFGRGKPSATSPAMEKLIREYNRFQQQQKASR